MTALVDFLDNTYVLGAGVVPTYTVVFAETAVAAGSTFVTVVADTPATDLTLVGYNAEVVGLLEARFSVRLITGTDLDPTIRHVETLTIGANGWQPIRLSVASGIRVAVQVVHDQIGSQDVQATINWSDP